MTEVIKPQIRNAPNEPSEDVEWERAEHSHQRLIELLRAKPEAKARYERVLAEIRGRQATLRRVREARSLAQRTIAEILEMDQSEVSRLERRSDVLLSTLRRFIQATGGELHLIASYPDMAPVEVCLGNVMGEPTLITQVAVSDTGRRTPGREVSSMADRRAGPRQGPYVKSPSGGGTEPRSRNKDGTWRKKRSDATPARSSTRSSKRK